MFYIKPPDASTDLVKGVPPFPLDHTFLLHSRPASNA